MAEKFQLLTERLAQIEGGRRILQSKWWKDTNRAVLPRVMEPSELIAIGIVGPTNTGVSTALNAQLSLLNPRPGSNEPPAVVSATDHLASTTKRMVVMMSEQSSEAARRDLNGRYGELVQWQNPDQARTDGPGILALRPDLPPNLAIYDIPNLNAGSPNMDQPENLSRAMALISPADLLIFVVTPESYQNRNLLVTMKRVFEHYGKKQMIVVVRADEAVDTALVENMALEVANVIYTNGSPEEVAAAVRSRQRPRELLATYQMPYSSRVVAGDRAATLTPLLDSPPYASLMKGVLAQADKVKQYSFESAMNAFSRHVQTNIRYQVAEQLTAQLYHLALLGAARSAARSHIQEFPFREVRPILYQLFQNFRTGFEKTVSSLSYYAAQPWQLVNMVMSKIRPTDKYQQLEDKLQHLHRERDTLAVESLLSQLSEGTIQTDLADEDLNLVDPTSPDHQLVKFSAYLANFYERFRDIEPPDPLVRLPNSGTGTLRLPAMQLLPRELQQQWQGLLKRNQKMMAEQLGLEIDRILFSKRSELGSTPNIPSFVGVLCTRNPGRRTGLTTLETLSVAAPAFCGFELMQYGISGIIPWAVALAVPAFVISHPSQMVWNSWVHSKIDEWYRDVQWRVSLDYFTKQLLPDFALPQAEHERQILSEIQDILQEIDPNYRRLPLTLDEL